MFFRAVNTREVLLKCYSKMLFGVVCQNSFALLTQQPAAEMNNFSLTRRARSRSFIPASPGKNKFQFQRAN